MRSELNPLFDLLHFLKFGISVDRDRFVVRATEADADCLYDLLSASLEEINSSVTVSVSAK